jgi:hypothetical protein
MPDMANLNLMDREWLNAEIDLMVREMNSISKRDIADALILKMKKAAERGNTDYMPLVWGLAANGITKIVADRIRQEHDIVRVDTKGHVLSLPQRGAVRQRDGVGVTNGSFQLLLWQEMKRPQFDEMIAQRLRRHDTETEILQRFVAMQMVWDKHPTAANVLEAIHLAGMSLVDFGFDLEATA